MKKTILLVVALFVVFALAGCGSNYAAKDGQMVSSIKTVSEDTSIISAPAVVDNTIVVKLGETKTIPINIMSEKTFAAFQVAIGYDKNKLEIVSSSLAAGEQCFQGFFRANPNYGLEHSDYNPKVEAICQANVAEGKKDMGMFAGLSPTNIPVKTLFAVTIKGVAPGEITLTPKTAPGWFLNTKIESIDVSFEEIKIRVEQ